uniref:Uncharacterized protein n=1 Tax=Glossina pallidipes TaxID=7398 RepID=A0A1A9ZHC4_GLOPL
MRTTRNIRDAFEPKRSVMIFSMQHKVNSSKACDKSTTYCPLPISPIFRMKPKESSAKKYKNLNFVKKYEDEFSAMHKLSFSKKEDEYTSTARPQCRRKLHTVASRVRRESDSDVDDGQKKFQLEA